MRHNEISMHNEYVIKLNAELITRTSGSKSGKTITQVSLSHFNWPANYIYNIFIGFFCLKVGCSDISEGQQWYFHQHLEFTPVQREYMWNILGYLLIESYICLCFNFIVLFSVTIV